MKYCILIIDGSSGLPLPRHGGKTCLELARTPNLDAMALSGTVGLARTVPEGMEPSSACACMSIMGYDPRVYYRGRATIEARSMGIPINEGEVVYRCNLVATRDGVMWDYSSGHISNGEAGELIKDLNEKLGGNGVRFYPGVSYRHICKLTGREETLRAACTPPHDIPGKPISEYLPGGPGSDFLLDLMRRSQDIFRDHPVNARRKSRGDIPADMIWLFWGSGQVPEFPPFKREFGLDAALTSGVDLLQGLAMMADVKVLRIPGVSDSLDNDYVAQIEGALEALDRHDLVIVHIEAPDEAAHAGSVDKKVDTIQRVDSEIVSRIRFWGKDSLRVLVMPDHATPIEVRTHTPDPVPFVLWGEGFSGNGAGRLTEAEAVKTDLFIDPGYNIMNKLING